MTSNFIARQLKATLALLILLISNSNSSVVLDFSESGDQLKAIAFNTQLQMLVHYEQMPKQDVTRPLKNFLSQYYQIPETDKELGFTIEYKVGGAVKIVLPALALRNLIAPKAHYIIMSSAIIESNAGGIASHNPHLNKWVWISAAIQEKTPAEIIPLFKVTREAAGDFAITHTNPRINLLKQLNTDEKGILGELLTRMTMFSFGYNVKKSLYEGNHGLDGIFLGFNNGHIFITQSKMGNSNSRAPTVMKDELNEPHICTRLQQMKNQTNAEVVASAALITDTLEHHPERVYKMAHCVLDKGKGQIDIKAFDVEKAPRDQIKLYGSPESTKTKTISNDLIMFSADPKDRLRLALKAANIRGLSKTDVMSILLEELGIGEAQHAPYLLQLDRDLP